MLSRLDAIQDIRLGRGIQLSFEGAPIGDGSGRCGKFNVIIRRDFRGSPKGSKRSLAGAVALIDCKVMRRTYTIRLTGRQVLSFIKRHYPTYSVKVQANPIAKVA